jgi:ubiquinone/menaquinone biosynthesis C-methylase UbiE
MRPAPNGFGLRPSAQWPGVEPTRSMFTWLWSALGTVILVLVGTAAFFFVATRGTLLLRSLRHGQPDPAGHVYPIYSNRRLMRLVDHQPIIGAILLFQYDRLVSHITRAMARMSLRGRDVLITSCAFGNVMPRVAQAAQDGAARQLLVVDIIDNELRHAQAKLTRSQVPLVLSRQDACALDLPDASVDANVIFFLLHELPHAQKDSVLEQACRVLAPGGQLLLAEFHRPDNTLLRALSWAYFKVFEPLGLALWSDHDPVVFLSTLPGMRCERRTYFFGNFQVIEATKAAA